MCVGVEVTVKQKIVEPVAYLQLLMYVFIVLHIYFIDSFTCLPDLIAASKSLKLRGNFCILVCSDNSFNVPSGLVKFLCKHLCVFMSIYVYEGSA